MITLCSTGYLPVLMYPIYEIVLFPVKSKEEANSEKVKVNLVFLLGQKLQNIGQKRYINIKITFLSINLEIQNPNLNASATYLPVKRTAFDYCSYTTQNCNWKPPFLCRANGVLSVYLKHKARYGYIYIRMTTAC